MKNLLFILLMAFAGVFPGEERARGEETPVLIHMNGRLYDPVLGRMLSPDNYIQAAFGSQGYNRYSYAVNNPLRFTDPSGEFLPLLIAGAALIGGGFNLWSNWEKVDNWQTGLAYFTSGAVGGAVSVFNPYAGGAITAGGNITIDAVTGNLPDINNARELAGYTVGIGLDALSAGMAGKTAEGLGALGKAGWRWIVGSSPQTYKMTLQTTGSMAGQYLMEAVEQTATKVPFVQMAGQAGGVAAKGGKNVVHHIASNKHLSKYTPKFESIANKYGLKLDEAWNKVDISDVYHYSRHPNQYHDFVLDGMMRADMGAVGNQAKFLQLFDRYVKQPLLQNPNILNKTGW